MKKKQVLYLEKVLRSKQLYFYKIEPNFNRHLEIINIKKFFIAEKEELMLGFIGTDENNNEITVYFPKLYYYNEYNQLIQLIDREFIYILNQIMYKYHLFENLLTMSKDEIAEKTAQIYKKLLTKIFIILGYKQQET